MSEDIEIKEQKDYIEKVKKINQDKKLKYTILTMGCQLNENDSEKLSGMIENMGYKRVQDTNEADLVVFNTCCVRENAEDKLFGKLGELKKEKQERGIIIAIGGCMMQEKHIQEKLHKSYPFFDIIFGTHTLHKFPEDLYKALEEKRKIEDVLDIDGKVYEGIPIKRNDNLKASVTIMYGCNNFCTYCIVPYVRGRERSRKPEDIIKEVKELAQKGYKEITLLGQNVNSYMQSENKTKREEEKYTFANLLEDIDKIEGIERIRFVSPHPKDFTNDVIEQIKKSEKICKIIHLPLQSGSTNILKKMNRKYTKEQYLELAEKIKREIPNVVFSTDIIVGFPGETEEEFETTYKFLKEIKFYKIHVFKYSKRKGTKAAIMPNQILHEKQNERSNKLIELSNKVQEQYNKQYIGKQIQVLIEEKEGKYYKGHTSNYMMIYVETQKNLENQIIDVKITKNEQNKIIAEII